MNKRVEEIQDEMVKRVYKIFDQLEKRIATLEKVLESHAKCIGELRGTELRIHDLKEKKDDS